MARIRRFLDWLDRVTGGPEIVFYEVKRRFGDPRGTEDS